MTSPLNTMRMSSPIANSGAPEVASTSVETQTSSPTEIPLLNYCVHSTLTESSFNSKTVALKYVCPFSSDGSLLGSLSQPLKVKIQANTITKDNIFFISVSSNQKCGFIDIDAKSSKLFHIYTILYFASTSM